MGIAVRPSGLALVTFQEALDSVWHLGGGNRSSYRMGSADPLQFNELNAYRPGPSVRAVVDQNLHIFVSRIGKRHRSHETQGT